MQGLRCGGQRSPLRKWDCCLTEVYYVHAMFCGVSDTLSVVMRRVIADSMGRKMVGASRNDVVRSGSISKSVIRMRL